jgi:predicted house-cleaning NTP pyrophosphatase (Maf/HAM1 superfamily)
MRVILASQSPRRRDLLTLAGITHEVQPADIDETPFAGEAPVPHAGAWRVARHRWLLRVRPMPSSSLRTRSW